MATPATESSSAAGVEAPPSRRGAGAGVVDAFLVRREAGILVVAVLLIIYFQSSNAAFLSAGNTRVLAEFIAATAILACGQVMLMTLGEIDLSVGQVFAFAAFVMFFATEAGIPLFLAVVLALIAGSLIGLVNGMVTVYLGVPSFITTLGTLFLVNGLTLTISDGFPRETLPLEGRLTNILGQGAFTGIIWAVVIVVAMHVLLRHTRWGLHTVAIGGNPIGSAEAGIRVNRVKIGNFMLCSALAAFVGIIESFRIASIDPLAGGTEIMFLAISAAVVGGTALSGGSGTIIGALIGAIVLSVLRNGFTLQGVSAFTFDLILGVAILIAMILNVNLVRLRRKQRA